MADNGFGALDAAAAAEVLTVVVSLETAGSDFGTDGKLDAGAWEVCVTKGEATADAALAVTGGVAFGIAGVIGAGEIVEVDVAVVVVDVPCVSVDTCGGAPRIVGVADVKDDETDDGTAGSVDGTEGTAAGVVRPAFATGNGVCGSVSGALGSAKGSAGVDGGRASFPGTARSSDETDGCERSTTVEVTGVVIVVVIVEDAA